MKLSLKNLTTLAVGFFLTGVAKAQLFIDQAQLTIQPGASVTVQGDVTSNTDILGTGKVVLKGTANQNVNMGGFTIPNLEIDNTSNVTLTGSAKVSGDVLFTNGKIQLGANNLTVGAAGTITGAGSSKFVVTNGTGKLVKAGLSTAAFTYPVGSTTSNYNPVAIANSGTADDIAVRAFSTVLSAGSTGTAFTKEVVNNSWDVSEAVAGGSNLTLSATWNGTDELPGFDRTRGGIASYLSAPAGWDLLQSQTAAATGTNPYTVSRTGVTNVGVFAVGTRSLMVPLLVSPKVLLQGAYNTGTAVMNESLRTLNLIPTTEPYSALTNFITAANRGSGGGEVSTSAIVGSAATSSNNSITDWVVVQIHNGTTGAILSQRAALLQRDGDVVDVDGVSPVNMYGFPAGNYYVSVRHRNHLGVRSAAVVALSSTATAYDFTTALNKAFTGTVTANNPMATLVAGSKFAMWAGNANDDAVVKMTGLNATSNDYLKLLNVLGSSTATQPNVYSKQDLNMDGTVKMTGLNATANDYLRLLNTLGSNTATITQPTF